MSNEFSDGVAKRQPETKIHYQVHKNPTSYPQEVAEFDFLFFSVKSTLCIDNYLIII